MRLILKLLSLPLILVTWIVYAICRLFVIASGAVLGILAFSCFWSIRELFEQEQRVRKGWFPKKEKRKEQ